MDSSLDLEAIVKKLRTEKGDTLWIEGKKSMGGLPPSIDTTICALANLPGGGVIILGLDEDDGFKPTTLTNIPGLKQGLIGKARACAPRVVLEILDQDETSIEGSEVVVAIVKEAEVSQKPVRVSEGGKGYKRDWDGDFPLSIHEEQGFQSLRTHPSSDRRAVQEATREDLDPDLIAIYEQTVQAFDSGGLGRYSGEELLRKAEVIKDSLGTPSVAGLLALGKHPQQFFPRVVIVLSKRSNSDPQNSRGANVKTLSGPIPIMLEGALQWARENFGSAIVTNPDTGSVSDVYDFPLEAFRELIGNALAHRDLAEWSLGDAIEVRLLPDRLVVKSPGGLFGITVEELGKPGTTSARNARLVEILKYTRTSTGDRVVETLSSGMPLIFDSTSSAGMPTPIFQDTAIYFSAILRRSLPQVVTWVAIIPRGKSSVVKNELLSGPKTIADLVISTELKKELVRYHLKQLISKGEVELVGSKGSKFSKYRIPTKPS